MKLEIHDHLRRPQTITATRIVVYDQHDNPLVYALEYAPGMVIADVLRPDNQAEFANMLHEMGVDKVVRVNIVTTRPLDQIAFSG